ncbi:MAG: aspartyl/asparaginyl beta-hydroxylase domain-containing protein [Chitinophagaceae bacterium]|nr:aspartyl/asparaginyl beta-hydroxylase domain-containing protein [Chitinophagaceae bacterium]MBK7308646.1 aspartyl/asparaginyl beta-hydroxylase domain-containing protein [Chitinophagaceae bacterium]MBL0202625.1 aspartyl/asparaginyl beta-hydroxylase domain-containing protein [Chitinophagaceae bacterium]
MQIIKYLKLPFLFDKGLLQQEVHALSAMPWMPHYQVKHYEGEWTAIPLRSIGGNANDVIISPTGNHDYQDTVFLERSPYMQQVLQTFQCRLQAVRLLKLNAGSSIKEHRDAELNFESGEIRLHIPVLTDPGVEFILDKERLTLQEGECWYMNFNLPHAINNNSSVNRVHLVIDALVNDWVKEIFEGPDCKIKKEIENTSGRYDTATKKQMIIQFREMNTELSNKLADELEKELSITCS